jgi:hypothetical protein
MYGFTFPFMIKSIPNQASGFLSYSWTEVKSGDAIISGVSDFPAVETQAITEIRFSLRNIP